MADCVFESFGYPYMRLLQGRCSRNSIQLQHFLTWNPKAAD